ncbi:MAG: hypothetical protein ACI4LM_02690 [Anaerovoracaceae bacterium]
MRPQPAFPAGTGKRKEKDVKPVLIGEHALSDDDLRRDKSMCRKIGPVGIGRDAIYLNSFYIHMRYYAVWEDVVRVYKQIAMSKGGFTGIGAFGAMSYLVVELTNGTIKRCNFKYERDVDRVLAYIEDNFTDIPTHSRNAERKLEEAAREEESRYLEKLSDKAEQTVSRLEYAKDYLEQDAGLYRELSYAAGKLRVQQNVSTGRRALGISIFVISIALLAAAYPVWRMGYGYWMYFLLFGGAFLIFSLSGNLVPIGRNSRKRVQGDWDKAVDACEKYISTEKRFPVPARYAHPVVLERMIRVVKEGRAETAEEALEAVKDDLKALNKSVTVSQQEYDEVVAVKPMFLVSDYR